MGVVQEVDAAAMSLWLKWREYKFGDDNSSPAVQIGCEKLDEITFGGLVNF